jgi:hypothetical protein
MNGKLKKLTTSLVLEVFWDCAWTGLKKLKSSDCSNLISLEFQQSGRLQNCITTKPWIVSRCVNNRWKEKKVFYNSFIGLLSKIPGTLGSELNFMTAAHSQVRFNVGARNFCFEVFLVESTMVTCHGIQHHDGVFILFPLVSTISLYLWLLNYVGITLKSPWTPLIHMVNPPVPFAH